MFNKVIHEMIITIKNIIGIFIIPLNINNYEGIFNKKRKDLLEFITLFFKFK